VWLDEAGESTGCFDVHNYIARCREYYESIGMGPDYVTKLFR
jgi:2,4'-dihydroxyacetophenone dioxygenase